MRLFIHTIGTKEIWYSTSMVLTSDGVLTIGEIDQITNAEGEFHVFEKNGVLYSTGFGALVHMRSYPESTRFPLTRFVPLSPVTHHPSLPTKEAA